MSYPVAWAYALEIEAHTGVEAVKLYISTSPALVTKPTDTPPSFTFADGLVQPGNYSISCFAGGKTYGQSSIGYGEIVLNNDVGQFDYLMDWAFDGRPAVLRRIDASLVATAAYPADWTTVYTGTLNQALPSFQGYGQGTISLQWRDRMVELQVPLPLAVFAGNNALPLGLEGTADDLKNKTKPLVLGQVYEMSPVCCNTAKLIYAVSPPTGGLLDVVTGWDAIADFDAVTDFFGAILGPGTHSGIANVTVYDSGVVIPQESPYTDENDMLGHDPSAGYCRILHDRGYVRFGSIPAGTVTVSCTDNSGEANTIGNLIAAPLVNYMKWGAERYNAAEISALNTACPLAMGVMIQDSAMTVDQLLDLFCRSAGVCYYFDAPGVFRAFQIQNPADLTADFVLTDLQIAKVSRIDNEGIPAKAVRIRQQRCWTVQTSGLASSVTAARRAWVANEWRENLSHNIYTAQKHLLSETLGFETAFAVDAQTEADRRRDIYSVRRDFLEVELSPGIVDFTSLRLGMVCNLQLSGRFGYNAVNMLVIGIAADLANEKTTLSLWG